MFLCQHNTRFVTCNLRRRFSTDTQGTSHKRPNFTAQYLAVLFSVAESPLFPFGCSVARADSERWRRPALPARDTGRSTWLTAHHQPGAGCQHSGTSNDDPSQPRGAPSQPGGDPSQPGGDPGQPGGVSSQPGGVPSQPGGDPGQPGDSEPGGTAAGGSEPGGTAAGGSEPGGTAAGSATDAYGPGTARSARPTRQAELGGAANARQRWWRRPAGDDGNYQR